MRYMLMICSPESHYAGMSEKDEAALMEAYGRFHGELEASGKMVEGNRLQPTPTATCVQVREGKTLTTDGPFAETKEQLGGYYLLECENLDQAIEWAARIPHAASGTIEVRPVIDFEQD